MPIYWVEFSRVSNNNNCDYPRSFLLWKPIKIGRFRNILWVFLDSPISLFLSLILWISNTKSFRLFYQRWIVKFIRKGNFICCAKRFSVENWQTKNRKWKCWVWDCFLAKRTDKLNTAHTIMRCQLKAIITDCMYATVCNVYVPKSCSSHGPVSACTCVSFAKLMFSSLFLTSRFVHLFNYAKFLTANYPKWNFKCTSEWLPNPKIVLAKKDILFWKCVFELRFYWLTMPKRLFAQIWQICTLDWLISDACCQLLQLYFVRFRLKQEVKRTIYWTDFNCKWFFICESWKFCRNVMPKISMIFMMCADGWTFCARQIVNSTPAILVTFMWRKWHTDYSIWLCS